MEGDSAGGSAEGGRMREYQAILPLRGKIINAYKSARGQGARERRGPQHDHRDRQSGIGAEQDIDKRRYGRVVIMTDADVDGSHIRTLLLTFFYRQMYDLVARGHVYVAQPPLFRVLKGKKARYVQTEEEMRTELLTLGLGESVLESSDGLKADGDTMSRLVHTLAAMEEPLVALERRGVSLKIHAERQDPATGKLPVYHVFYGMEEHWLTTRKEVDDFIEQKQAEAGDELVVEFGAPSIGPQDIEAAQNGHASANGSADAAKRRLRVVELHEVRTINTLLGDLSEMGFEIDALIPKSGPARRSAASSSTVGKRNRASTTSAGCPRRSDRPARRACRSSASKDSAR